MPPGRHTYRFGRHADARRRGARTPFPAPPARNLPAPARRNGLTLLEVLLALAIFVGSWAVLGQLLSHGVRGSVQSQLQTEAMLRCEARLAELVAGAVPFAPVNQLPFDDNAAWLCSISLTPSNVEGLYEVEVTVSREGGGHGGASFTLKRLAREPEVFSPVPSAGGTSP